MKYEKSMLLETIGNTLENRVIDFLIEGKGISYSKKDIAEGCAISRPTIYKILPSLVKNGIIKIDRKIGKITLFKLNETNERVRKLLKLEEILLKDSFKQIESQTKMPA